MNEDKFLRELARSAADNVSFFGNRGKIERERAVCRAYLRALGVTSSESELKAPAPEPSDVIFRDAKFQVKELLDSGRRRGDEVRSKAEARANAEGIEALLEKYTSPTAMVLSDLASCVAGELKRYSTKYSGNARHLDALVYVNFRNRFLVPELGTVDQEVFARQCWRSVSALLPPYGMVLYATADAPEFLLAAGHEPHARWPNPGEMFDPHK